MHLLVREAALAAVGAACCAGVQRFTPLTEDVKRPFLAAIVVATLLAMTRAAGLL